MPISSGLLNLELASARLMPIHRTPPEPAIANVSAAVQSALENPLKFPALRRALTPDDHVAIVVDEQLADLPSLLTPLLEHLVQAHITPDAITLICVENADAHAWAESLPGDFRNIRIEDHNPHNRKKLSYLATTRQGRRVYLNRTAVDADQLVVLSRRFYDPLLGIGGAEGAIYPALSDADTRRAVLAKLSMAAPDQTPWGLQKEAKEVAWLLGAPFFLQVIEAEGDAFAHILGGLVDNSTEAERLLNACWRLEVEGLADIVVAQVGGSPARQTFGDFAHALASASRVVKAQGKIILISDAAPELGAGAALLRQADTADEALQLLMEHQPADLSAAFQWANAAQRADLYLLTNLSSGIVEEMLATPLSEPAEALRLANKGKCLLLQDAEKTLAIPR